MCCKSVRVHRLIALARRIILKLPEVVCDLLSYLLFAIHELIGLVSVGFRVIPASIIIVFEIFFQFVYLEDVVWADRLRLIPLTHRGIVAHACFLTLANQLRQHLQLLVRLLVRRRRYERRAAHRSDRLHLAAALVELGRLGVGGALFLLEPVSAAFELHIIYNEAGGGADAVGRLLQQPLRRRRLSESELGWVARFRLLVFYGEGLLVRTTQLTLSCSVILRKISSVSD